MTQGAGQGPDVWHGGAAAHGTSPGSGAGRSDAPAVAPAQFAPAAEPTPLSGQSASGQPSVDPPAATARAERPAERPPVRHATPAGQPMSTPPPVGQEAPASPVASAPGAESGPVGERSPERRPGWPEDPRGPVSPPGPTVQGAPSTAQPPRFPQSPQSPQSGQPPRSGRNVPHSARQPYRSSREPREPSVPHQPLTHQSSNQQPYTGELLEPRRPSGPYQRSEAPPLAGQSPHAAQPQPPHPFESHPPESHPSGPPPHDSRRLQPQQPVGQQQPPPQPGTPYAQPPAPQPPAPHAPPPGEAVGAPSSEEVPDYTPTQRDMPMVGQTGVPYEATLVDVPAPAPASVEAAEGEGPLYVVGDIHGYLDELREALRAAGIIDGEDHWVAGNTRLWFLGDFTDRGPDGVGVIDLVMHLSAEAAAAGGYCKALMGNHELLLIGAKRFGDTPVNSGAGTASFQAAWLLNGGQRSDMERLQEHHIQWMSRLDAMTLADDHLLVHSDATCYLEYGSSIDAVNDTVTQALQQGEAEVTWDLFRKFTKRFAFRNESSGAQTVRELLDAFGGERIVHGHSPIPYLLGEVGSEDEEGAPDVTGPHTYADGLAIAMDGGVTMAGKLLVTQLPLPE